MNIEEKEFSAEFIKKEFDEVYRKLKKEEFENKQLRELVVSMALELKVLRNIIEDSNNH